MKCCCGGDEEGERESEWAVHCLERWGLEIGYIPLLRKSMAMAMAMVWEIDVGMYGDLFHVEMMMARAHDNLYPQGAD